MNGGPFSGTKTCGQINMDWEDNTYAGRGCLVSKTGSLTRANWMDANLPGTIITEDPDPDPDPDPVTGIDDEFMRGPA
jgi:hypothetical protein